MTEHAPQSPSLRNSGRDTPSSLPRPSYETGESSATRGSFGNTPMSSRTLDNDDSFDSSPASNAATKHRDGRSSRKLRHRSGGFLLNDSITEKDAGPSRIPRRTGSNKMKEVPQTPEHNNSDQINNKRYSKTLSDNTSRNYGSLRSRGEDSANGHIKPALMQGSPLTGIDSTQIVNMALNLSESRRIASGRRNISSTAPPRLSLQPDSSTGSNLKQHLQQQRKVSLAGGSPKPSPGFSPRIPSLSMANSPLQTSFDPAHDGLYRYQFSASTLSRAEKAKEQLELKAEYRRLLEVLPPLKPANDRVMSASPPSSPTGHLQPSWKFGQPRSNVVLGRQYNPLQYIRNRKIRARERKVIDGEQQGFGDVDCVRAWVDKATQRVSSSLTLDSENGSVMPSYPAAEAASQAGSSLSRTSTRARRPRVDWFMEPCDMIADAYWIEQNDNRHLIENRNWRKIYPPPQSTPSRPMSSRPMSQQLTGTEANISPFPTKLLQDDEDPSGTGLSRPNTGSPTIKARDRTKHKLHEMKAFHHRHTTSLLGNHDFLNLAGDSDSSSSDSENEGRGDPKRLSRRGRTGTISSNSNDVFNKQMHDMMIREAQEKELLALPETIKEHEPMSNDTTPDKNLASNPSSIYHSRKGSVVDVSDSDQRAQNGDRRASLSAYQPGRASLEVPMAASRRNSQTQDSHSSVPTSPELHPHDGYPLPTIGTDMLSPRSRSPSPSRNPVNMVKRKWRERDRDGRHKRDVSRDRISQTPTSPKLAAHGKKIQKQFTGESQLSVDRPSEFSPSHRSSQSLQLVDEQVGLRGIFKPRIDGIRGGVSKIGDILWKKNASGEFSDPDGESETESRRGRSRGSLSLSRPRSNTELPPGSKHFLNTMPEFHHAPDANRRAGIAAPPSLDAQLKSDATSSSRPGSSHSSRLQTLKPPRIDVRGPSPSGISSPFTKLDDSDQSDTASRGRSTETDKRVVSKGSAASFNMNDSRHWSIADRHDSMEVEKLTRKDIARMRALILSSGIKAMEINRRAREQQTPFAPKPSPTNPDATKVNALPWSDIARLSPVDQDLSTIEAPICELYVLASSNLCSAIQMSGQKWQQSADRFTSRTAVDLQKRIWNIRNRVTQDLSGSARLAADEADETARELNLGQPLKLKKVFDLIDRMAQNKRRRFRWLRRGVWLVVEWTLVGFMWYVWFVVMIFRIFWGVGRGVVTGVKWLLWM